MSLLNPKSPTFKWSALELTKRTFLKKETIQKIATYLRNKTHLQRMRSAFTCTLYVREGVHHFVSAFFITFVFEIISEIIQIMLGWLTIG